MSDYRTPPAPPVDPLAILMNPPGSNEQRDGSNTSNRLMQASPSGDPSVVVGRTGDVTNSILTLADQSTQTPSIFQTLVDKFFGSQQDSRLARVEAMKAFETDQVCRMLEQKIKQETDAFIAVHTDRVKAWIALQELHNRKNLASQATQMLVEFSRDVGASNAAFDQIMEDQFDQLQRQKIPYLKSVRANELAAQIDRHNKTVQMLAAYLSAAVEKIATREK